MKATLCSCGFKVKGCVKGSCAGFSTLGPVEDYTRKDLRHAFLVLYSINFCFVLF